MKSIFKLLSLALLVTILSLTSCTEEPEESTGSITGYVTESGAGTEPLSGVTVSILANGRSTTTGSDGTFSFTAMQPGQYSLQFSKTGYNTNTRTVNVVAGQENRCDIQLTKVNEVAEIVINPSSLNFGTTQTDMSVTIKNNGNTTAEWALNLGNNPWLSASQLGGSIQAGRTQSITFSVDRNYISEPKTTVVNLQAFGNSYPLTISCAPRNTSSTMVIEPTTLNFGSDLTQQTFTIRNTGNAPLTWHANNITTPALSLSATQGTVNGGGSSVIIVTIDRSLVSGDMVSTFIISDGIIDQTITVNITSSGGGTTPGGGDEPGPGDDPGQLVVTNGLAAYYTLNDNYDDTMGEYDGFGINDPTFVTGISGQATQFSKANESSILVPYGMISNKTFSISFWVKDLNDGVIFYSKCSDNQNRFTLSMDSGRLKFVCYAYNNRYESTYKDDNRSFIHSSITDNKWHHIAIVSEYTDKTYSDHTWSSILYIDGKRASTITETKSGEDSGVSYPNSFIIGGKATFNNYSLTTSNFTVDNFRIYDSRLLTADEIKVIYNARQ